MVLLCNAFVYRANVYTGLGLDIIGFGPLVSVSQNWVGLGHGLTLFWSH